MPNPVGEDPPIEPIEPKPYFLMHQTSEAVTLTIEPWWYNVNDDIKHAVNTLCAAADLEPTEVTKLICVLELPND